jgi:hypothetical protein
VKFTKPVIHNNTALQYIFKENTLILVSKPSYSKIQFNVVNALMEAIEELKSQIEAIDPKETLKVANVKQYQVKRDVNESVKNRLVQRVINKLKK